MESDSWTRRVSAASKRYQSALQQTRSDLQFGFEEIDVDDDAKAEFVCPFCSEEFDVIGLCCHIDDEHPVEAKNGVCPVCGARVGMNMVGHITMQHGQFFKMQRRRRIRKIGSHSTLSLLRKELREGNLQSLLAGSSYVSSSNAEPDPLLSSFVYNLPDEPKIVQTPADSSLVKKSSDVQVLESAKPPPLSHKEQEEKNERCKFVQELLLSTFLDDTL